jgi:hypothetical protein
MALSCDLGTSGVTQSFTQSQLTRYVYDFLILYDIRYWGMIREHI